MYDSSKGFTIGIIVSLLLVFLLGFSVKEYKPEVYKRKKYKLVRMKVLPKEKPKPKVEEKVKEEKKPEKKEVKEKPKEKKKKKPKKKKKKKKVKKKKVVAKDPINQKKEKPKEKPKKKSPPIFGVTMSSVTKTGNSSFKVKVGNTLMTDDSTGWKNGKPKEIGKYEGTEKESSDGAEEETPPAPKAKIVTKAIAKKVFRPKYSKLAEDEEIEGKIILKLTIDKKGNVIKAKIIKGLGYGLDKATLKVIKKFKFSPAVLSNGKTTRSRITYTINFILED